MPARARAPVTAAGVVALAVLLRLVVGNGLANYDTLYQLVWGRQIGHGHLPDYDVSLAPTPHPLQTVATTILSPLSSASSASLHGGAATSLTIAGAFGAIAILGWIVYELGAVWIHPAAGAAAAVILLTRQPVLDFGARAYVDIPYLCLALGALLVESRRPRAGAPVLVLLGLAGLIRPEAWLFSAAYLVWLWVGGVRDWRLWALAAVAPLLWACSDLVVTGNPLHSLTGTRDDAQTLGRKTGIANVPTTVPRRIGEILREPGLLAAAGGGILSLVWLRERVKVGVAAGVLALVAFATLATAGLPILGRYLLGPAAILAVFAGAGLLGWLALPAGDARRRPWQAFAVVALLAFVAFTPKQVDRIRDLRHALRTQNRIQDRLGDLVKDRSLPGCGPLAVPNHRPVPLLALWLDRGPTAIHPGAATRGTYVAPATPRVAHDYILDRRDPVQSVAAAPRGFTRAGGNATWLVTSRCDDGSG